MRLPLRIALTLIVTIFATAYVLPSIPQIQHSPLAKFLPDAFVNLGLDLKGGIHLKLGVDVNKALENMISQTGQDIKNTAERDGIYIYRPHPMPGLKLQFTLPKAENKEAVDTLLKEKFPNLNVISAIPEGAQVKYLLELTPTAKKETEELSMDQAVKTLRSRIDEFGVAEPEIRRLQDNSIQIQLPGLTDPARAIKVIEKTAHLEFRMVTSFDGANHMSSPDTEVLPMIVSRGGKTEENNIVLQREIAMTGETITDARVGFGEHGDPEVLLSFNTTGAAQFERMTEQYKGGYMAIVLDNKVYSAPRINDRISGGRCSISGQFTVEEANDLALILRAGSLPAPVEVLEERAVGPSLGQESIEQGINACLVGGLFVVLFMIVYYGFTGFIADVALILNVILILAGLAGFGATLTLPGIAGIILTIGTAVDANVLINERIREELRRGLTIKAAIEEGYARATITIIDSHVTSIIAALVLYQFGTGPIRGFAVTLTLGLVASLFTAVFVTRVLMDIWVRLKKNQSTLSV